jgi:hypothetical protein
VQEPAAHNDVMQENPSLRSDVRPQHRAASPEQLDPSTAFLYAPHTITTLVIGEAPSCSVPHVAVLQACAHDKMSQALEPRWRLHAAHLPASGLPQCMVPSPVMTHASSCSCHALR